MALYVDCDVHVTAFHRLYLIWAGQYENMGARELRPLIDWTSARDVLIGSCMVGDPDHGCLINCDNVEDSC